MNEPSGPKTILIADDHALMVIGIEAAIGSSPEFEVVGRCHDGAEALYQIEKLKPQIAILDMQMPGMSGLEVLSEVTRERFSTSVVLLTAHMSDRDLAAAVAAGAAAVLFKSHASNELLTCLRAVSSRRQWFPLSVETAVAREAGRRNAGARILEQLTERETQVLVLAAQNMPIKLIAARLTIADGTVKIHLNNIYSKLGIQSRTALIELAQSVLEY